MIKQDYLIRMIQEIVTALVNALLRRRKITHTEWNEYESIARQILETTPTQLQTMTADDVLSRYQTDADSDKIELAAMMLLKMAEDTEGNLLLKSKLRQDGLTLLQHIQTHGNTYSLQRELLITFLKTNL